MSDLVRLDCDDQGVMHPHSDGDWCDYSEAQAEIERLKAESEGQKIGIAILRDEIERLEAVVDAARHLLAGGDKEAVYHLEKALAALEDRNE